MILNQSLSSKRINTTYQLRTYFYSQINPCKHLNYGSVDYYAINSEGMYFHVFSLTDGK